MEIRKLYINGEWVDSVHDEWIEIENPATHEIIAKVPRGNKEDVDKAVKAARAAFETWQYTPLEERVALMKKVVEGLESRRQELIETITKELGSRTKFPLKCIQIRLFWRQSTTSRQRPNSRMSRDASLPS